MSRGKSYDRGNVKAYNTYGTSRINAYKIIEETPEPERRSYL